MSECMLADGRLDDIINGRLEPSHVGAVVAHLRSDCSLCASELDGAGLDEETLLAMLAGADSQIEEGDLDRVWNAVRHQWHPRTKNAPRRTWSWFFGGALAASAAVLLVAVWPRAEPYSGLKGSAELPRAVLTLVPRDGAVPSAISSTPPVEFGEKEIVEIRYGLERAAFAAILHAHGDERDVLFAGRLDAAFAGDGAVPIEDGRLGYAFAGEAGTHRFVLLIADEPIVAADVFELYEKSLHSDLQGTDLHVVRVQVTKDLP